LRKEDCTAPQVEPVSTLQPAPTPDFACQWFALYTCSRHEKRVSQHLDQRDVEHFLPLYQARRKWRDGSRVTLDLPLFPGYLFVRIHRTSRARVLSTPGALALVGGTGREPAPLPESAIAALRTGLAEHAVEPHPLLTVGQQVRIRSGAFAGMSGVVCRKKAGLRVVLTLQQIMQSVSVEVNETDLEPDPESRFVLFDASSMMRDLHFSPA